jgi:hypothetical protein
MPLNPEDPTSKQLRDLDEWIAEHKLTCRRPPAKFVVPEEDRTSRPAE